MSMPKSSSMKGDSYSTSAMTGASINRPPCRKANISVSTVFAEYGKWFLGINDERPENTKAHYVFPFGDFRDVHRCGILAAESRAGQYRHCDIENAAAHLHGMLKGRKAATAPKRTRRASPDRATRGTRHSLR